MDTFVQEQTATLLRRLASNAQQAAVLGTPKAVHDLRAGIQRLNQCLRFFGGSFPAGEVKKIRRELKRVMDMAGEVHNLDIAIELLKKANAPADATLAHDRRRARKELAGGLESWSRHDFSRKSRERLNV